MHNYTDNIQRSFDRAANSYDHHCDLQYRVGTTLIALIKRYANKSSRVIDLGCGTGKITSELAHQICYDELHAIDISEQLLAKASLRLLAKRHYLYQANFDQLTTDKFDLIFSNMALHWSQDIQRLFANIYHLLTNTGLVAFSIPLTGTFVELENKFRLHHFYAETDISHYLQANGLQVRTSHVETIHIPFDDTLSALRSIKSVAANYVANKITHGLKGRHFINNIELQQLTYVIGFFIASKTI